MEPDYIYRTTIYPGTPGTFMALHLKSTVEKLLEWLRAWQRSASRLCRSQLIAEQFLQHMLDLVCSRITVARIRIVDVDFYWNSNSCAQDVLASLIHATSNATWSFCSPRIVEDEDFLRKTLYIKVIIKKSSSIKTALRDAGEVSQE